MPATCQDVKRPCPSLPALTLVPLDATLQSLYEAFQQEDDSQVAAATAGLLSDVPPSPASTLFTPASTPCSESDDSGMVDSLSPPPSPWFPSSLDMEPVNAKGIQTAFGPNEDSEIDFFNNTFYQSLPGSSHPRYPAQEIKSATSVVRSRRAKRSAMEVTQTAAPSDLFNVAIDEVLSSTPLNLDGLIDSVPESQVETEVHRTSSFDHSMTVMASEQVSDNNATKVAWESSTGELELDSLDTGSEDSSATQRCRKRPSSLKAPRVRKYTSRTPKVYPPRKSRTLPARLDMEDQSTHCSDTVVSSPSSHASSSKLILGIEGIPTTTVMVSEDGSYKCGLCPNERFGRVHDLKRHQISKHNEKTWPCDFCKRPFVRRDALLRHYGVKASRDDGIHPTLAETNRLSEAKARARLR
ncbi:hypothetical protein BGX31_007789 [Mortierella sp. GBA43]|nr:hypothetical protein BGX31_007789 [Mortierella sp. GBA43]